MQKPLPVPTDISRPFWEGLNQQEVRIQRCDDCGHWVFYPRNRCSHCLSDKLEWKTISGTGVLYSYTFGRIPTAPEFADEKPQVLAVVALDEGPRLNTSLRYLDESEIRIGMRLKPVFEKRGDMSLLQYTGLDKTAPAEAKAENKSGLDEPPCRPKKQINYTDIEAMKSLIGEEFSAWSNEVEVTQDLINQFAELSGDNYWIHTDVAKAKKQSPFGGTIAQGALVQVLQSRFTVPLEYEVIGFNNMANYGSDKLRFPSPVPAGAKIHMRTRVKNIEASSSGTRLTMEMHTHVVGQERPSVINEMVIQYM